MATYLVTGGAGFIGSCLVRQLLDDPAGHRVVTLDALTYAGNLDSLGEVLDHPRHVFLEADICDPKAVKQALHAHAPEAILHLAAESHVDRSIDSPGGFVATNVLGTFTLLDAARHHWKGLAGAARERFRFLNVSTDEVFGSLGPEGHFREETPYAPNSPYSASKASADHFVRAFHHTYGLPTLVTNCSNNYGPRQFPEKLIPLMILNALEGRPLPVYGDGGNIRDWLYVEDHCRAIRLVLERGAPGETYVIGGDCERTNLAIVRAVCGLLDALAPPLATGPRERLITFVADRPGHDRRYAIDASAIRRRLGWKPGHDFESGLRATVHWYLSNPEWVERVQSGSYRRERLGLG